MIQKWNLAYAALDKFDGPDGMIRVQQTLETIAGQINNLTDQISQAANSSKNMANNLSGAAGSMKDISASAEDFFKKLKAGGYTGDETKVSLSKYHEGTKFVTKKKTPYDSMFGIKEDETLSILKVGEAVIPKNENLKMSSSGNYLDQEVADNLSRMTYKKEYSVGESSTSVSIGDIIIQGSADENTVLALRKERESIVKSVFDRIQSHNQRSGFRNMKLAPI